jgi:hypothetical protein
MQPIASIHGPGQSIAGAGPIDGAADDRPTPDANRRRAAKRAQQRRMIR